jgi:uncharacterized protein (DUF58 family)
MEFTHRYWAVAGLGLFLAFEAVILDEPLLLGGTTGVAAWLLTQQYLFVRDSLQTVDGLSVSRSFERTTVSKGSEIEITLDAALSTEAAVQLDISEEPPVAASRSNHDDYQIRVPIGKRTVTGTYSVTMNLAGRYAFPQPTAEISDRIGLFRTTTKVGTQRDITVETKGPEDLSVSIGGKRVADTLGEHKTGQQGTGIDPEEIREYVPGDSLRKIEWKATARLNRPHIREFESQVTLQTAVLMDLRPTMATGDDGETKLDYARQVALSLLDYSHSRSEPFGLYTIDETGVTTALPPSMSREQYETVRSKLQEVEIPTPPRSSRSSKSVERRSPIEANRVANRLRSDGSQFDSRLQPFFSQSHSYIPQTETNPLYEAAHTELTRLPEKAVTIILTDDTDRNEVRETVKLMRQRNRPVLVFLTPTILFVENTMMNVEDAYERYLEFESFRKDIARLNGVQAFEVGPGDVLDRMVSAANRDERTTGARR